MTMTATMPSSAATRPTCRATSARSTLFPASLRPRRANRTRPLRDRSGERDFPPGQRPWGRFLPTQRHDLQRGAGPASSAELADFAAGKDLVPASVEICAPMPSSAARSARPGPTAKKEVNTPARRSQPGAFVKDLGDRAGVDHWQILGVRSFIRTPCAPRWPQPLSAGHPSALVPDDAPSPETPLKLALLIVLSTLAAVAIGAIGAATLHQRMLDDRMDKMLRRG